MYLFIYSFIHLCIYLFIYLFIYLKEIDIWTPGGIRQGRMK